MSHSITEGDLIHNTSPEEPLSSLTVAVDVKPSENKIQEFEKILESVEKMTVEEYENLYEEITPEEDVIAIDPSKVENIDLPEEVMEKIAEEIPIETPIEISEVKTPSTEIVEKPKSGKRSGKNKE